MMRPIPLAESHRIPSVVVERRAVRVLCFFPRHRQLLWQVGRRGIGGGVESWHLDMTLWWCCVVSCVVVQLSFLVARISHPICLYLCIYLYCVLYINMCIIVYVYVYVCVYKCLAVLVVVTAVTVRHSRTATTTATVQHCTYSIWLQLLLSLDPRSP